VNHLRRLRCAECRHERVGWISINSDGLWLTAHHHAAAPRFTTGTTIWAVGDLDGIAHWECPECQHSIWIKPDEVRAAARQARRGKIMDLYV
jgi:hypothetical protein